MRSGRATSGAGEALRSLAAAGAVTLIAAAGCEGGPPRLRVTLTEEPAASTTSRPEASRRILRVGIASVLSPRSALPHYGDLIAYLGERLDLPTEMVQRPNYAEMNELMRNGHCMVGLVCNYAFLRAEREFGARMLAAPVVGGRMDYQGYIIVGSDTPYRSLADLEGRRIAFADPLCNAGWLYPRFLVKQLGRPPDAFFAGEVFTYDYETSIRAVAQGLVDVAGVEGPLYDRLISKRDADALRTRILDRSVPLGNPPVAVHPDLDEEIRGRVREFFQTLHDSERGRAILSGILVDRFAEPDRALYAPVNAMAEALERP